MAGVELKLADDLPMSRLYFVHTWLKGLLLGPVKEVKMYMNATDPEHWDLKNRSFQQLPKVKKLKRAVLAFKKACYKAPKELK